MQWPGPQNFGVMTLRILPPNLLACDGQPRYCTHSKRFQVQFLDKLLDDMRTMQWTENQFLLIFSVFNALEERGSGVTSICKKEQAKHWSLSHATSEARSLITTLFLSLLTWAINSRPQSQQEMSVEKLSTIDPNTSLKGLNVWTCFDVPRSAWSIFHISRPECTKFWKSRIAIR